MLATDRPPSNICPPASYRGTRSSILVWSPAWLTNV